MNRHSFVRPPFFINKQRRCALFSVKRRGPVHEYSKWLMYLKETKTRVANDVPVQRLYLDLSGQRAEFPAFISDGNIQADSEI